MTSRSDPQHVLFLDVETYCEVDISDAGLYRYTEDDSFEILLLSACLDAGPVKVFDMISGPNREAVVQNLARQLTDPRVRKVAHNCAFERAAINAAFCIYSPPEQWRDTMDLCRYNGLPGALDDAGAALHIERQKLSAGADLVRYFCTPCKPTKANGGRRRNLPADAPDKWGMFKAYNARDVEAMQEIYYRLERFPVTDLEESIRILDTQINERGVRVDQALASCAHNIGERHRVKMEKELQTLTGIQNPKSVQQLRAWLHSRCFKVDGLRKDVVSDALTSGAQLEPDVRRVLELRQTLSKTSTTKYDAMLRSVCADGRIRGILQYYGASRTGRWAGRLVQLQNLPQNHLQQIELVRQLVLDEDLETLEACYDSVPDVLSQLIRTALVAENGCVFLVADFSAIEARVIAYLAGEQWRMDVFRDGGDIYCSSASAMFHVPVVKHGINGHLRQKGKIAELACGYGGGVNALRAFGAEKMGLTEEEMQAIVDNWRAASPKIPKLWRDVESAAKKALQTPGRVYSLPCGVAYKRDADALRCLLPSGRMLSYWEADLDPESGSVRFMGQNQTTKKWERVETWGGKLVENVVQAFARDCLGEAMLRLDANGYKICFHVHDEVILEAPEGARWEDAAEIMGRPIPWAPGLILTADGYSTPFYMKD